jgi:CheY-like chemotaxis protein/two-component sensor histidine kinase
VTARQTWRSVGLVTDRSDPHRDLAGVLHDVSNALTVLLGWVGEARAPGASAEEIAYALSIVEQRARLARDLARHAIGGSRVDEQRELGAIVEELAAALRVEAQRTNLRLDVSGASVDVRVAGALDVAQVLTNLVLNAFAHAPPGSTVSVVAEVDDERCAVLVCDEGPGVLPERRDRIFLGESHRPGGIGVGLRHSRALARSWGGDVALVSPAPGETGARFRVTWPRVDPVLRPPMSTPREPDLSGVRVLIVEDDPAVLQLLEAALDARGAQVTVASDQKQLAAALAQGPYEAALVDLSPIALDVPGELEALRQSCPGAAVVLITGSADALPEGLGGEGIELVRKPFEVREVVAALRRRSGRKQA